MQSETEKPAKPASSPEPQRWSVVAWGGLAAVGVAWAAHHTAVQSVNPQVGNTAWICAAVVGTASVIAAAAARMKRPFDD